MTRLTRIAPPDPILSIEHTQSIRVAADGTTRRGHEIYIKKYVGLLESGLLAKLSGNANKILDVLGLRARILGDLQKPGAAEEFQQLMQLGIVRARDRGRLFCFISQEQLGIDAGIHRHTVEVVTKQLVNSQLIERITLNDQQLRLTNGRWGATIYFINPASFVAKFDPVVGNRVQKLDTASETKDQVQILDTVTVSKKPALKNVRTTTITSTTGVEMDLILQIGGCFAKAIGVEHYQPTHKETQQIEALLADGYSLEDFRAGIQRVANRQTAKRKPVRSLVYCLPAVRDTQHAVARTEAESEAEMGSPEPKAVMVQSQAVTAAVPQANTEVLDHLAGGNAELRDLLEVIQVKNPTRRLDHADVRAWQRLADDFASFAVERGTTPIGLVLQGILEAISANSNRGGFLVANLVRRILERWRRKVMASRAHTDLQQMQAGQAQLRVDSGTETPRVEAAPVFAAQHAEIVSEVGNAFSLWHATRGELQLQMTKATFDTWVRPSHALGWDGTTLVIGVHSPYAKEWLENRLQMTIQRTLTGIIGCGVSLRYRVDD